MSRKTKKSALSNAESRVAAPPRRPSLTAHMRRFPADIRDSIHMLAASQSRLGDLAYVFPGTLVSMISLADEGKPCRKAVALAVNGAALRDVAKALGLPMWLRHLQPEAFENWWPPAPGNSEAFGRRIKQLIPDDPDFSAFWLGAILEGAALVDDDYALWLAMRISPALEYAEGYPLLPLALFAWYSGRRDSRLGALINRPFKSTMSLESAIDAAEEWYIDVNLEIHLPKGVATGGLWMQGGRAEGYTFVPLTTAEDLAAEAHAMGNCLRRYAQAVADRECLMFSVRKLTRRVAVVKIDQHLRESSVPVIDDIKGPHNVAAPRQIWSAAYVWLGKEIAAGRADFDNKHSNLHTRQIVRLAMQRRKDWRAMTLPFFRSKSHLERTAHTAAGRQHYAQALEMLRGEHGLTNLEGELRTLSTGIGRTSRLTYGI